MARQKKKKKSNAQCVVEKRLSLSRKIIYTTALIATCSLTIEKTKVVRATKGGEKPSPHYFIFLEEK
jgi:hypothetical protein